MTGRICAGMLMPHPTSNRHASHVVVVAVAAESLFGSRRAWACQPAFGCGHWRSQTNNDGTAGPKAHLGCAVHVVALPRAMMCVHFDSRRASRTKPAREWMDRRRVEPKPSLFLTRPTRPDPTRDQHGAPGQRGPPAPRSHKTTAREREKRALGLGWFNLEPCFALRRASDDGDLLA